MGAAAAPKKASRGAVVLSPFAAVAYWRPVTVGLVTNDTEYRYEQREGLDKFSIYSRHLEMIDSNFHRHTYALSFHVCL